MEGFARDWRWLFSVLGPISYLSPNSYLVGRVNICQCFPLSDIFWARAFQFVFECTFLRSLVCSVPDVAIIVLTVTRMIKKTNMNGLDVWMCG